MSNKEQDKEKYDLVERTATFGKEILFYLKSIPPNQLTRPIIDQLVRAATSVGANFMEADCAESKNDFRHKIAICKKEAKETAYWLEMMGTLHQYKDDERIRLQNEAKELNLIFSSIIKKLDSKI